MDKLQVINAMLGTIGESPVNSIDDEENELLNNALQMYDRVIPELLSEGWWFNTEIAKLSYDVHSERVKVPNDALQVRAENPNYVIRGLALYDVSKGDWVKKDVTVELIRNLPIEEIPTPVCYLAETMCSLHFIRYYDADTSKINQLQAFYVKNRADSLRMHTKCSRPSLLMSPHVLGAHVDMGRRGAGMFEWDNRFGIPKDAL